LRGIRPRRLSADLKAKVIAMVRKQDVISPSAREGRVKLAALEPVLKYHERGSVIDLVVMQADQAGLLFLAGAAVVISEKALGILNVGELQATVAHELGHEYFWNEYEMARENRQYDKTKELELRCDGLAVITMSGLGLDPSHLISALNKLARSHKGDLVNGDLYPSLEERIAFIRAMIEVVKGKRRGLSRVTSVRPRKQSEACTVGTPCGPSHGSQRIPYSS